MLNPKENLLFSNWPFENRHKIDTWSRDKSQTCWLIYSATHVVLGSQQFDSKKCCLNGLKSLHMFFWEKHYNQKNCFHLQIDNSTTGINKIYTWFHGHHANLLIVYSATHVVLGSQLFGSTNVDKIGIRAYIFSFERNVKPERIFLFSNGPFNYRHKNNRHLIPWSDGQLSNLVIVYSTSHVVLGSQLFDSKECCLNRQKNLPFLFWEKC
jgi:hypothetical protein